MVSVGERYGFLRAPDKLYFWQGDYKDKRYRGK